ncbi:NTP transferase domain-containing protein [Sediminibacterium roseum]|uniref:NTP transferase domain-containing protein n=1 Tax=Sediminibacterium roseum TaxID=1978412 RepID=A0ABW9ZS24_9BACT|nr:sugar phosphate nucleotidyltransferase [Sediminibacterium roseum]NCI49099.1 NTP transferase domain-containing protein [Sediminibacterium roseum]
MNKHAIILAGGKGTRLRPYTWVLPKPLMPIGEQPILEVVIRQLAHYGFTKITMAVNHQAELIKAFFGDGKRWNVEISYSMENEPLGTMGPLHLIDNLPQNFLIMNGDILTDIDFAGLYNDHIANTSLFTISGYRRRQKNDYGVLDINEENRLINFKEKPITDFLVSMGIYVASKEILEHIPRNRPYGFDHLMHDLIAAGKPVTVNEFSGYWLDIGRPDDYIQAIEEFETLKSKFIHE